VHDGKIDFATALDDLQQGKSHFYMMMKLKKARDGDCSADEDAWN
jgi:hypothetical protein